MEIQPSLERQAVESHRDRGLVPRGMDQSIGRLNPALEPFLVTGGLFTFTALYYTRQLPLQILSGVLLAGVALYWSRAIRGSRPMTWADFRLTRHQLGRQVLIGTGLAVAGWFGFRFYVFISRGVWMPLGYGGSLAALLSIVSVASGEELFFRGYLQNRLRGRFGFLHRVLLAVLALALYKNIVHLWAGMPLVLHVELFALSVLLAMVPSLLLEWSDNLAGPIALHVVWDLLVYGHLAAIPYWVF